MERFDFVKPSDSYLAAVLLVLAFITFAIGASLPLVGRKGNPGIFTLPVHEYLLAVANNNVVWRWANIFMGSSAVILLAGLALLTILVEQADKSRLSQLGLIGMLLAVILWLIFSAFRATVVVSAAQETMATGSIPAYYPPLAQWAFALFFVYAAVGFLALAGYGGALLQVGFVPIWAGWATILFSTAMLILLFATGDTLPAFHYVPPLLIAILLLR
jgi:hypothetical protein